MVNAPVLSIEIRALYWLCSSSVSRSLCIKNWNCIASFPIILLSIAFASAKLSPVALFNVRDITGYFPIYLSHSFFSLEISSPSKSAPSLPLPKKYFSMLIFRVFPKRLGRVNKFTYAIFSSRSFIRPVLSI